MALATDAVLEAMQTWQSRPLDLVYPVLLVDAIYVKIRERRVSNRPVYVVMGITVEGERDVLGLWAGPAGGGEGARQWLAMLTKLNRGVQVVKIWRWVVSFISRLSAMMACSDAA